MPTQLVGNGMHLPWTQNWIPSSHGVSFLHCPPAVHSWGVSASSSHSTAPGSHVLASVASDTAPLLSTPLGSPLSMVASAPASVMDIGSDSPESKGYAGSPVP